MMKQLLIGTILMMGMAERINNDGFKEKAEEAKKRWHAAKNLPRKQKKKVRKEAELEYLWYMDMIEWDNEHQFIF